MEQFVSTFSASGQPPKETCKQCRFRKVRCDGKRGEKGCGDCERLKFDCSFINAVPKTPTSVAASVSSSSYSDTTTTNNNNSGTSIPSPTLEAGRVVERRRTSKACAHCRQQKVRCSGGAPCLVCKKKGVTCVYASNKRRGSRVASSSAAGTPTEASFGFLSGSLGSSSHNNVDEVISGTDEGTSAASPTSPATTSSEPVTVLRMDNHLTTTGGRERSYGLNSLPPDLQTLIEFYFNHVYPLPSYAFLHPATTIRQAAEGTLETSLTYALAAVASYHKSPPQNRSDSELNWIERTEDLIWRHLEAPTLPRLQALLLAVLYRVETGAFQRAFMLSSIAARAAAAMRLNHEQTVSASSTSASALHDNEQSHIRQEVRRRVMWSLKLVERYFCMGLPEFELCPVESIYLELPCPEDQFSGHQHQGLSALSISSPKPTNMVESADLLHSSDQGAYQLCIKLEMLRRDIVKLTRSLSLQDAPFPNLPSIMSDFESHLEQIGFSLPSSSSSSNSNSNRSNSPSPSPTLTTDRIARLVNTPYLPRHLLAYLSYHQCHCDLYRILLPGHYREAAAVVTAPTVLDTLASELDPALLQKAEQLCLHHATAIVDILATLNQASPRAQLLEFDTAICGYHAVRILLHIAQLGSSGSGSGSGSSSVNQRPSEEWALSRAELCMASLKRFFPTSRLVKPILEEMRRAIEVFASRSTSATATPGGGSSRRASPGLGQNAAGGGAQAQAQAQGGAKDHAAAARVRQRLAIHSLLRQADFTDDEEERHHQQRHQHEDERRASEWSVSPPGTMSPLASASAASWGGYTLSPFSTTTPTTTTTTTATTPTNTSTTTAELPAPRTTEGPSSLFDGGIWRVPWACEGESYDGIGQWERDISFRRESAAVGGGGTSSSSSRGAGTGAAAAAAGGGGGGGGGPPKPASLSFPWLRRWEGHSVLQGEMA